MTAGTRLWIRFTFALFLYGGMVFGLVTAQTPEDTKKKQTPAPIDWTPPPVFNKVAPESIEELRDIEKHVQQVLEKVMPSVVGVRVGPGQGSGVIISEDGLVLTAGHVSGTPNQNAFFILFSGKKLKAKTLGQYKSIDSGMLKIVLSDKDKENDRKYPFLEMGKSSELKRGQWVMAIGHPGGFRANRTPVVRVGRILVVNQFVIRTDCSLVGGDSGGPLFDMQGRVIGIHSRIGGAQITENIHVPIDAYRQHFAKLEKGESWGGQLGTIEVVRSAGGKVVFEKKDKLDQGRRDHAAPHDDSQGHPAAEAKQSHFKTFTFRMKAGATYTLEMFTREKKAKKVEEFFDPYLRLLSPEGKELAQDDDGAGSPNARLVYKALKDGDYKIVATTYDGEQTGNFTLKIFEADFKDAFVSGKVEVLKAIKIPPPAIAKLLEESAKENKIPLHINAILLDDKGNLLANKEIVFNWEKGTAKVKSDNQGIVRWPLALDKSRKLNLELPTGAHAMLGLTDQDGNYVARSLNKDNPDFSEKVKGAGGTIVKTFEGTLKKSDPFDFERDKCYRHIHEFKMQAGKTYTIDLASDDFNAYLRLEDADGNKLAEDDDSAGFLNSRIVHTPAGDGTFRIVVTTCTSGELGGYRVTVRAIDATPAEPKK